MNQLISFKNYTFIIACLLFNIVGLVSSNAATINVNSINALQTACNNSSAGDIIVLANGTYNNVTLDINNNSITVISQTPGGVFLNVYGDININGNNITFSGFQFTQGDIGSSYLIEVYGSRNKLTQLNFSNYYAKKYIEIKAGTQYNEITYCNMEKKPADAIIGCTIQISTSPSVIGYHKISYCSFQNYYGLGGDNGNEPVRIGLGAEYLNKSRTIVEYCLFNNTGLGDSESISVKCQENVIRYCTFTNQQNAMLCFRNGDNNVAYSNFFINAGGIRVKEANNIYCYNNYFENSGVGSSADAITYVYVAPLVPPTTASPRTLNLSNINFIHNTFYNCGDMDLGGNGLVNNTWANNIFRKSSGNLYSNANNGTTWVGNIYQGTIGINIPSGMTNTNPFLALNANGYYGLTANSPVNNANASSPAILDIAILNDDPGLLFDIAGRPRPTTATLKDVGCEEYITGTVSNRPLTLADVGPSYLVALANEDFELETNISLYPNPAKNNFSIQFPNNYIENSEITIVNTNGQIVKKQSVSQNDLTKSNIIAINGLNSGLYFVKIESIKISKVIKLIVQ
jgi:hypothetical protein